MPYSSSSKLTPVARDTLGTDSPQLLAYPRIKGLLPVLVTFRNEPRCHARDHFDALHYGEISLAEPMFGVTKTEEHRYLTIDSDTLPSFPFAHI